MEVARVFIRQEGALVMVEPPGDLGRAAVFEIDDRVFIAREERLIEKLIGAVKQAAIEKLGLRIDPAAEEVAEDGGRAGAIETAIVIEDPNAHGKPTSMAHLGGKDQEGKSLPPGEV
jgi:hypothetical protein